MTPGKNAIAEVAIADDRIRSLLIDGGHDRGSPVSMSPDTEEFLRPGVRTGAQGIP